MRRAILAVGAAVAIGAAAGGGTVLAAGEGLGMGHGLHNGPLARLLRANLGRLITLKAELDVTDEQKGKIREALLPHKAEFVECVKGLHTARRRLGDAVRAEATDEAAIRDAASGLSKAIGEMAVLGAKARKEVLAVLTAEQRSKIEATRASIEESVDREIGEFSKEAAKP